MNQTAGRDDLLNTTIIEGLADDVCPVSKSLAEVIIITEFAEDLLFDTGSRILLLKSYGKRSRNASLSTLVPMKRPSSEPLPFVLAVAKTWKPSEGLTKRPIFFRKTPFLRVRTEGKEFCWKPGQSRQAVEPHRAPRLR